MAAQRCGQMYANRADYVKAVPFLQKAFQLKPRDELDQYIKRVERAARRAAVVRRHQRRPLRTRVHAQGPWRRHLNDAQSGRRGAVPAAARRRQARHPRRSSDAAGTA